MKTRYPISILVTTLTLLLLLPPTASAGDRSDLIFESFENDFLPPGWSIMTSGQSNTWEQNDAFANSGSHSALVRYGQSGEWQDEWLVTPAMDLTNSGMLFLEFFEMQQYWNYGHAHSIAVSTTVPDDPTAFTMAEVWTPGNHPIPTEFGGGPVVVDLSAFVGHTTVYVAFRFEGEVAGNWFVDDVYLYEPQLHDIAALDVFPHGHLTAGSTVTPQALLENVGQSIESFEVNIEILAQGLPVYSETVEVTDLAPRQEIVLGFPAFLAEGDNYYETHATTFLLNDQFPDNDSVDGGFETYTTNHVPMVFLFTNGGCGPCVQANQAIDEFLPSQGGAVGMIRIHTSWPNSSDIMYRNNVEQSEALVDEYGVGGVPSFWLDGLDWLGSDGNGAVNAIEQAQLDFSPLSIIPSFWNSETEQLTITLDVAAPLPVGGDYRLILCITEDNIFYSGGNGEHNHNQAFRRAYPSLEGMSIPVVPGIAVHNVDAALGDDWVFDELRVTCYLQDQNTRRIWQAGTQFLNEITGVSSVGEAVQQGRSLSNYPNPFNPSTTISYELNNDGPVQLQIFDVAGRLVKVLVQENQLEGPHELKWNGRNNEGKISAAGVYFYQLIAEGQNQTRRMVLVR